MIENPQFLYSPTPTLVKQRDVLEAEPRRATNRTLIILPRVVPLLLAVFVTELGDPVTPVISLESTPDDPVLTGTPIESLETQLYVLGHGYAVPKGEVARVTGTLDAPGFIRDAKVDLRVEFRDAFDEGPLTGNFPFIPSRFYLTMIHEGPRPTTYRVQATLGGA